MKRPVESDYTSHVAYTRALEEYCDALPQLAQEPVAWLENLKRLASICPELNMVNYSEEDVDDLNCWAIEVATCIDSITNPPAAQRTEPVGCVADIDRLQRQMFLDLGYSLSDPLYTSPPAAQQQWVGLTDEQRKEIRFKFNGVEQIQINTEAKLKEKNT